jgi:hypothetical protein
MISSAKMLIASDSTYQAAGTQYVTLADLESKNYLDTVNSPDADGYTKSLTSGSVTADTDNASFVKIAGGKVVGVKLVTAKRGLSKFVDGTNIVTEVSPKDIKRSDVTDSK